MKTTILRAKRIVTAGAAGTVYDGAIALREGKIEAVGTAESFGSALAQAQVVDFGDQVIAPGLIDCHSHLMEYAAASIYPVTEHTHTVSVSALLLTALASGITAVGDHICGFPGYFIRPEDCLAAAEKSPLRVRPALCSITLGGEPAGNFTAVTGNVPIPREQLMDPEILKKIIDLSAFPGENVFITATPANLPLSAMPNAGKLVYSQEELDRIAKTFHDAGKKLGAHVGGEEGIDMALNAGIDVLHHAHGMTPAQMQRAREQGVAIVDTPLGGTHLPPRSAQGVVELVKAGLDVSLATDAYLPAPEGMEPLVPGKLYGPEAFMAVAAPAMQALKAAGYDENHCLALITKNPAAVLGLADVTGQIAPGLDADLIVCKGIPGLEILDAAQISAVYRQGVPVIRR
ncbi:MAG: amidohydrolase family protein [Clostridia bacterium]|nr:amidohydrolase family protein [Clostridia bacterium]